MKTQKQQIKEYLESLATITPLEALRMFGCMRLGARIYDLKRDGMEIKRKMKKQGGKVFAEYYIKREENKMKTD